MPAVALTGTLAIMLLSQNTVSTDEKEYYMKATIKVLLPLVLVCGCLDIPGVTSGIPGIPGGSPMMNRSTIYEQDTPQEEGLPEDAPDMSALLAQMGQKIQAPALQVDPEDLVVGRYAKWAVEGAFFSIACVGSSGYNKVLEYKMGAEGSDSMTYVFHMSPSGKAVKAFVVLPDMAPMEAKIGGAGALPYRPGSIPESPQGKKGSVTAAGRTFDSVLYQSEDGKVWVSNDVYFWPFVKSESEAGSLTLSEIRENARPTVSIP